jgi:hypothetical protein
MTQSVEINPGEVKVKFTEPVPGKVSLKELGVLNEDLYLEGGMLRLVFDFEGIGEHHFYQIPKLEINYKEEVRATHWQCEFNDEVLLDTVDHYGSTTILMLDKEKIKSLEQHHENKLIVHAEFPEKVHVIADQSYIHFFK